MHTHTHVPVLYRYIGEHEPRACETCLAFSWEKKRSAAKALIKGVKADFFIMSYRNQITKVLIQKLSTLYLFLKICKLDLNFPAARHRWRRNRLCGTRWLSGHSWWRWNRRCWTRWLIYFPTYAYLSNTVWLDLACLFEAARLAYKADQRGAEELNESFHFAVMKYPRAVLSCFSHSSSCDCTAPPHFTGCTECSQSHW